MTGARTNANGKPGCVNGAATCRMGRSVGAREDPEKNAELVLGVPRGGVPIPFRVVWAIATAVTSALSRHPCESRGPVRVWLLIQCSQKASANRFVSMLDACMFRNKVAFRPHL